MSPSHKPEGQNSVSPYLIVDGAGRTIDFLARVFDATRTNAAGSRTPAAPPGG